MAPKPSLEVKPRPSCTPTALPDVQYATTFQPPPPSSVSLPPPPIRVSFSAPPVMSSDASEPFKVAMAPFPYQNLPGSECAAGI